MEYRTGSIGRVVVARFSDGEDLLEGLREIAKKESLRQAFFFIVGGLKGGEFVVGPEGDGLPPKPMWRGLKESHEVLGFGTIFWEAEEPRVHLHGAYGRGDNVKVGCLRKGSETFLILEVIVLELQGVGAIRERDPQVGLPLLRFI
ncbi:MAG: DNA-binding protein [Nitrospirae bacterium]|nr:MAG: DNA-binding protein [Nitrospirota bacterium]